MAKSRPDPAGNANFVNMATALAVIGTFVGTLAGCALAARWWRSRSVPAPSGGGLVALRAVGMATVKLPDGLSTASAGHAAVRLHAVLGCTAVAITDTETVLGRSGPGIAGDAVEVARIALSAGRAVRRTVLPAADGRERLGAYAAPITVDGTAVGALVLYTPASGQVMAHAVADVARLLAGQLALGEMERANARIAAAELRALRAQISPHFIYNCLNTIASFVRTDPERARTLLAEFADFARYAFRYRKESTSLSNELRTIDRYLSLERARFGDRLHCDLQITPEVLPVSVPFLCLQPLVENAVKHGMEGLARPVHITVRLRDAGPDVLFTVEDDGTGIDPERLRSILSGRSRESAGIGLANIDQRMRQLYGAAYGLRVDTAPGAGTKVSVRIPKYRAGVAKH